jgi:surface antigen
VLLFPPRPAALPRLPAGNRPTSSTVTRVAVLLLLCAACYACVPLADARDRQLRPGPPADGYPFSGDRGLALDPWGFVLRECTSYAAWYLNAHGVPFGLRTRGPGGDGLFTSAGDWDRAAAAAGFAVRSTPVVGSIAQWDPRESSPAAPGPPASRFFRELTAGRFGHVAVVQRVLQDGSVVVTEYNGGDGRFHVVVTRAPRYLYIGVEVDRDEGVPRSVAFPAGGGWQRWEPGG